MMRCSSSLSLMLPSCSQGPPGQPIIAETMAADTCKNTQNGENSV